MLKLCRPQDIDRVCTELNDADAITLILGPMFANCQTADDFYDQFGTYDSSDDSSDDSNDDYCNIHRLFPQAESDVASAVEDLVNALLTCGSLLKRVRI